MSYMRNGPPGQGGPLISSAASNRDLGSQNSPPGCGGQAGWRFCRAGICRCLQRQIEAEDAGRDLIPPVPFIDAEAEVDLWARFAGHQTVRRVFKACWHNLSDADRRAFVRRVT